MRQLRQFWNQNERGDKKDPNFNRWRPAVSILSQNIPACLGVSVRVYLNFGSDLCGFGSSSDNPFKLF